MQRYLTVELVSSWTDTGDYVHSETLLLELTAPSNYGDHPIRISFFSLVGPVHTVYGSQATANSIAAQQAGSIDQVMNSKVAVASSVSDCSVGGEAAAVFGYLNGDEQGYQIYMVRSDFLFVIRLSGTGGLPDQAISDALGMIGTVRWTS